MKRFMMVVGGSGILVAAGAFLLFAHPHNTDFLLAPSAVLTSQWTELSPPKTMRTTGDWSEVYVELPDLRDRPDGTHILPDGSSPFIIEGYLLSKSGEKLSLDELSVVGIGTRRFLTLSNRALEWKHDEYRFRSIVLRSARPLNVGRIVWSSYDPQSTKSGVRTPDSLGDD